MKFKYLLLSCIFLTNGLFAETNNSIKNNKNIPTQTPNKSEEIDPIVKEKITEIFSEVNKNLSELETKQQMLKDKKDPEVEKQKLEIEKQIDIMNSKKSKNDAENSYKKSTTKYSEEAMEYKNAQLDSDLITLKKDYEYIPKYYFSISKFGTNISALVQKSKLDEILLNLEQKNSLKIQYIKNKSMINSLKKIKNPEIRNTIVSGYVSSSNSANQPTITSQQNQQNTTTTTVMFNNVELKKGQIISNYFFVEEINENYIKISTIK